MKPTNTVAKLFGSVSTLAVVASIFVTGVAWCQGSVIAWGANFEGQCNIPVAAKWGVTAITSGSYHNLALKDGAVLAWGMNYAGQCNIPIAATSGVSAIACGYDHTIALKSGQVFAWGGNSRGECNIPTAATSGVSAIACGTHHNLALKNGQVIAWGYNGPGACLGTNSDGVPIVSPSHATGQLVQIMGQVLNGVDTIACGMGDNSLALKNGAVLSWGYNPRGLSNIPTDAQSGVSAIAEGYSHAVALKDGVVIAWGDNEFGQCNTPIAAKSGVSAIACGMNYTCALKDGVVIAWGDNDYGQCNIPTLSNVGIIAIACGFSSTIALRGPPETITGVFPISGPSIGGTNITITGTNFEAPATVTIGGAPATNVVVVSDTQITATTPAGFPGPAVVTVNLGSLTAFYYRPSCGSDLDNNGVVDSADLGIVLLDFGNCYESAAPQEPMIFPMPEAAKPVAVKSEVR